MCVYVCMCVCMCVCVCVCVSTSLSLHLSLSLSTSLSFPSSSTMSETHSLISAHTNSEASSFGRVRCFLAYLYACMLLYSALMVRMADGNANTIISELMMTSTGLQKKRRTKHETGHTRVVRARMPCIERQMRQRGWDERGEAMKG